MSNSLPQINPTSPLGSILNEIIEYTKANTLIKGGDIALQQTSTGTIVNLDSNRKNFANLYAQYKGEWINTGSYAINDVVRVTKDYDNSTKGVFICVYGVPDKGISDALYADGWPEGCEWVRVSGVNYNPIYPEPTKTIADVQTETDITKQATIRYWELISLLPIEMSMCVDGVETKYFIQGAPSGSFA